MACGMEQLQGNGRRGSEEGKRSKSLDNLMT